MLIAGLSIMFFFIAIILALIILFLQGKGDLGASSSWQGGNAIFGGSGGQDVIGKIVWGLGIILLILCLFLAKYSPKYIQESVLNKYISSKSSVNENVKVKSAEVESEEQALEEQALEEQALEEQALEEQADEKKNKPIKKEKEVLTTKTVLNADDDGDNDEDDDNDDEIDEPSAFDEE